MSDKALFLDYKNYYKYHKKQYSDVLSDLGYLEFVHDKLQKEIQDALAEFTPSSEVAGANYVTVLGTGTPEENATELQEAYDTAKTMSPSATNRVTVIASPGEYQFPSRFVMDTEYVDLVSLTGNKDVIFDLQGITDPFDPENGNISECFYVDTDNVYVKGIKGKLYMSPNWDLYWGKGQEYNLPIHIASNLPNIVIEKCEGGFSSFRDGAQLGNPTLNIIMNGTFTDCVGGDFSFGTSGTASGTFTNCVGGVASFGGFDDGIASGTFTNCVGGDASFGSATASGTFTDCTGGGYSFGGSSNGTASGTFTNCVGGEESFGGRNNGTLSGKLYYCRLTAGTFKTVSSGGRTYYCVDGNGDVDNQ